MPTPDQIRDRYLDELIGAASVLDEFESAAVAEAWASGAVAEWHALDGAEGRLAARVGDSAPLAAVLIEWIDGADAPTSVVGAAEPEWLADVGRHELTRAVRLKQSGSNDAGVILEYTAPSGDRHDLSVSIEDGVLIGIAVGPEGLAIAAVEADRDGVSVDELEPRKALELVRDALGQPLGELSPAAEATLPLVVRRVGFSADELAEFAGATSDRAIAPRDPEDDKYSAELITSALRGPLAADQPEAVSTAFDQFVARVADNDPDALTLFEIAGLDIASFDIAEFGNAEMAPEDLTLDDFVGLVGCYLAPASLDPHTDPQFAALIELEPADWIGVIVGMSRAAPGTDIDGDTLVKMINKAPEITTTIPKADAPRLAWTFEQMLYAWEVTGVLTSEGAVSHAASWLLPRAALAAWV